MNLWLRLLRVFISSFFKKRLTVLEESCLEFRTGPADLDIYGHMNNGRFLTLMDLGRIDLILRSPLGGVIRGRRWNPLVGSVLMRYRRPLKTGDAFVLRTRILCWDEKWFYLEQRFEKAGELAAAGYVKGLFFGPEGSVPAPHVLENAGHREPSPPMPEKIRLWIEAERVP